MTEREALVRAVAAVHEARRAMQLAQPYEVWCALYLPAEVERMAKDDPK